jgi:hypothetical protein
LFGRRPWLVVVLVGLLVAVTVMVLLGLKWEADAVAGVTKRKIGDRWAFNRCGDVDVSTLVAASLAVWGVTRVRIPVPAVY